MVQVRNVSGLFAPVLIKVANRGCWTIFNFLYHRHRANYLETGRPRYRLKFDFPFYLNPFEAFRQLGEEPPLSTHVIARS